MHVSGELAVVGDFKGTARLIAQRHAHVGQAPYQESLGATDLGHGSSQRRQVETPVRPVTGLPDIFAIAAIHAEIMSRILRMRKLFTAAYAAKECAIRRSSTAARSASSAYFQLSFDAGIIPPPLFSIKPSREVQKTKMDQCVARFLAVAKASIN